jgi:hypothetical protein
MAYDEEQSAMSSGAGVASGGPGGFNFRDKKAAMAKPMPSSPAVRQSLTLGGLGSDVQRVSALANVAVQGSNTVYALPARVTVPNDSATMVLLLNQSIPGESVFLFSPDPGVPDSASHPFRVARFANTTKGLLEKGPIAVFDSGSFLGEGMLDPLPPDAKATVPFALDRSLAVQTETRQDERGARLYRVEAGHLYVERDSVLETTYLVKNGGAQAARVLLKHPRSGETTLEKPPPGTEDNVGSGFALIPTEAPARGQNKLIVTETRPWTNEIDWLDPLADLAIKAYLQDPKRDGAVSAKLTEAWAIRMKVRQLQDENDKLARQQNELNNALEEIRRNLRAIEKNTQAGDLRAKLTARLGATSSQYDGISKRLVELGLAISENQVRLRDALLDLNIPVQHR